ncbi:MAG: response regulator [Gemmatimonadota bacterium]
MNRVLVVDDREENLYYLESLLQGHGVTVERARNGEEALEAARASPPDIVVSDLLMPVMDGYTLLRHWKADVALSPIPFVVYTATYTEAQDEELARELGADAFIVKPAEPDALLRRIREVYETTRSRPPERPRKPTGVEESGLEAYNRVLVRKLEKKMFQVEEANRALQVELEERTRAQEQLEHRAALLRIAGQVAQLGGWSIRLPERIVTWSDETCAIHDVPAGHQPTPEEAADYCLPEHRETLERAYEACMVRGKPFDLEASIVTAKGRRAWVRAIGEPMRDGDGAIVGVQGAIQDITDRKQLEQRLLRSQRMESIATLTGGMAHDLNNVLSPILLSLELLREDVSSQEARETISTIEECAQRGSDMVRQVLSFARGVGAERREVEIGQVVHDAGRVARDTFPDTIRFTASVASDLWSVYGDDTQIHQVLMNSFVNARDAMTEGGTLTVSVENVQIDEHYAAMSGTANPGPYARISVTDTGTGMPAEVLPHIFDPLFTTKAVGAGTGIGLATVATILRSHGGFVTVYSEVGRGTTFRFHFPARSEEGSARGPGAASERWQGGGAVVLVVDDEAAVRSITQQTLEAFGYKALTAADGEDALDILRKPRADIDVVVTDMTMPRMGGAELVGALRDATSDIPVLAVTGMGAGASGAAPNLPVSGRLAKPYTADELLDAVSAALASRRGDAEGEP